MQREGCRKRQNTQITTSAGSMDRIPAPYNLSKVYGEAYLNFHAYLDEDTFYAKKGTCIYAYQIEMKDSVYQNHTGDIEKAWRMKKQQIKFIFIMKIQMLSSRKKRQTLFR